MTIAKRHMGSIMILNRKGSIKVKYHEKSTTDSYDRRCFRRLQRLWS